MRPAFCKIIPVIAVFFISCSKKQNDPVTTPKKTINITGNWKWVQSVSGWGGLSNPDADSIVRLKLNADSTYIVSLNNQVRYAGHYSTFVNYNLDSSIILYCDTNISVNKLRFNEKEIITYLKNDTCRFYDYLIMDGSSHLFIRTQ